MYFTNNTCFVIFYLFFYKEIDYFIPLHKIMICPECNNELYPEIIECGDPHPDVGFMYNKNVFICDDDHCFGADELIPLI